MDNYFKKQVKYKFKDIELKLNIGETLFSTFDIDKGSDHLIRHFKSSINPKRVLDIGCGYGIIGIYFAKKYLEAEVQLLDRDLLAVKYSNINIELNEIQNAKACGSIGMERLENGEKFDLIFSNIPAKIGDKAIENEFILDPINHLTEQGEYWVVIVNALNHLIPKLARKHQIKITQIHKRSGHIIYRLVKSQG